MDKNELELQDLILNEIGRLYGGVCSECPSIEGKVAKASKESFIAGINYLRQNLDKLPEVKALIEECRRLKEGKK